MTIGEYLRSWRESRGEQLTDIQTRAKRLGNKRPPSAAMSVAYFSRVETGRANVAYEHFEYLATAYEADIVVMLCCLPIPHGPVVHLTQADEFKAAPFVDPDTKSAEYVIAKHRLGESDLALVFLKLQPGGRSRREHSHQGDEVIKVEKGEVVAVFPEFPPDEQRRTLKKEDILHFESGWTHFVENCSSKPAYLFIIRRMASSSKQSSQKPRQGSV